MILKVVSWSICVLLANTKFLFFFLLETSSASGRIEFSFAIRKYLKWMHNNNNNISNAFEFNTISGPFEMEIPWSVSPASNYITIYIYYYFTMSVAFPWTWVIPLGRSHVSDHIDHRNRQNKQTDRRNIVDFSQFINKTSSKKPWLRQTR